MDRGIIDRADLPRLAGERRFYAPARAADSPAGACELAEAPENIAWGCANVRTPLKRLFLPQTETLCTFDFDEVTEAPAAAEPLLVFGARPCDTRALAQLDAVFGPENKGYADPYYLRRREAAVVISLACTAPCPTCFCAATGGGPADTRGADLIAHELGLEGRLLLEAVSAKGRQLLEANRPLLGEATELAVQEAHARAEAVAGEVQEANALGVDLGTEVGALKRRMDPLFEDRLWERLTASCIGCGACTYLCPTCHCFDIADEARLYEGRRIRTWDSCQFPLFTRHASGHNPRSNRRQRLRQRFMHKFSYAVQNMGEVMCVGCGRCITACPVNLDIRDVIRRFTEEPARENAS